MANDLFRRQLGVYASVHRDWRNRATHFVGIPVVLSLLLLLSLWTFELGGRPWTVSLAVAILAARGWMALDLGIGIDMALITAVAWYAAEALAGALGSAQAMWIAFIALFVGGWCCSSSGITMKASARRWSTTSSRPSSARCSWSPKAWSSWASAAISPTPWAKATSRPGEQG
jgi:hypothetical protein